LKALFQGVEGGLGSYLVIKSWRNRTIFELQLKEKDWLDMSVDERARMIVACHQEKWFAALEMQRFKDEAEARRRAKN
jgi:hypothetical protein